MTRLIDNAGQWYKMTSIQAAVLLAVLETVHYMDAIHLPPGVSIFIALMIPVLRVLKQDLK